MSARFGDGENDYDYNINPYDGWIASAISGRKGQAALHELLDHLLAMPNKKILFGQFYDEATGSACTVGEFAKMRGMAEEKLKETNVQVQQEDGYVSYGGWESPTVEAGKEAGLTSVLAYDLGSHNDSIILENHKTEVFGPPVPYKLQFWQYYKDISEKDKKEYHKQCYEPYMIYLQVSDAQRWEEVVEYVRLLIARGEVIAKRRSEKRNLKIKNSDQAKKVTSLS